MPSSKRPSPRAEMEDDEAAADTGIHRSPPRSSKRSKTRSRSGDRRRSPNPNPRSRADYYGSEPSRKSERKRIPRSFPDSALLSQALAGPASSSAGLGGHGAAQKLWTDADEIAMLNGAISFRARNGIAPRLPDVEGLFHSLSDSLSPHINQAKVYYKLKRLKSKFCNTALPPASTPHERRVRALSADLWGAEVAPSVEDLPDAEEPEEEDAAEGYAAAHVPLLPAPVLAPVPARLPLVSELLGEYWRRNARAMSGVSLEKGLGLLGAEEGVVAESKWRRQLDAEMRTQVRRHDLAKEVFGLLSDTIKGLGP